METFYLAFSSNGCSYHMTFLLLGLRGWIGVLSSPCCCFQFSTWHLWSSNDTTQQLASTEFSCIIKKSNFFMILDSGSLSPSLIWFILCLGDLNMCICTRFFQLPFISLTLPLPKILSSILPEPFLPSTHCRLSLLIEANLLHYQFHAPHCLTTILSIFQFIPSSRPTPKGFQNPSPNSNALSIVSFLCPHPVLDVFSFLLIKVKLYYQ